MQYFSIRRIFYETLLKLISCLEVLLWSVTFLRTHHTELKKLRSRTDDTMFYDFISHIYHVTARLDVLIVNRHHMAYRYYTLPGRT